MLYVNPRVELALNTQGKGMCQSVLSMDCDSQPPALFPFLFGILIPPSFSQSPLLRVKSDVLARRIKRPLSCTKLVSLFDYFLQSSEVELKKKPDIPILQGHERRRACLLFLTRLTRTRLLIFFVGFCILY